MKIRANSNKNAGKVKVKIMGVLNVTPNSFSDGGEYFSTQRALEHAKKLIHDGVDIIDVGGESSGPDSVDVVVDEELKRVIPVIEKIGEYTKKYSPKTIISVDTYKAQVARQAIAAGARMVNDVTALRGDPALVKVVARAGVPIVLMYAKDATARTTRDKKNYTDVVKTIMKFFDERISYAVKQGIKHSKIIIDPGMGAFVSGEPKYSYEILRRLGEFKKLGLPILIGASRKSFLPGAVHERDIPTLIAHMVAVHNGASIIRTHVV